MSGIGTPVTAVSNRFSTLPLGRIYTITAEGEDQTIFVVPKGREDDTPVAYPRAWFSFEGWHLRPASVTDDECAAQLLARDVGRDVEAKIKAECPGDYRMLVDYLADRDVVVDVSEIPKLLALAKTRRR